MPEDPPSNLIHLEIVEIEQGRTCKISYSQMQIWFPRSFL